MTTIRIVLSVTCAILSVATFLFGVFFLGYCVGYWKRVDEEKSERGIR